MMMMIVQSTRQKWSWWCSLLLSPLHISFFPGWLAANSSECPLCQISIHPHKASRSLTPDHHCMLLSRSHYLSIIRDGIFPPFNCMYYNDLHLWKWKTFREKEAPFYQSREAGPRNLMFFFSYSPSSSSSFSFQLGPSIIFIWSFRAIKLEGKAKNTKKGGKGIKESLIHVWKEGGREEKEKRREEIKRSCWHPPPPSPHPTYSHKLMMLMAFIFMTVRTSFWCVMLLLLCCPRRQQLFGVYSSSHHPSPSPSFWPLILWAIIHNTCAQRGL